MPANIGQTIIVEHLQEVQWPFENKEDFPVHNIFPTEAEINESDITPEEIDQILKKQKTVAHPDQTTFQRRSENGPHPNL